MNKNLNNLQKTIGDFVNYERGVRGLSESTISTYTNRLSAFWEYCNEQQVTEIGQIKPGLVYDYMSKLAAEKKSGPLRCLAITVIKELIKFIILTGEPTKDLTKIAYIQNPKITKKIPFVLSIEQVNKLLSAPVSSDTYYRRDLAILELLYSAGLRTSELVGLKESNLNFAEGCLLCCGKGRKERLIPVGVIAQNAVNAYLRVKRYEQASGVLRVCPNGDYVFLSRTGSKMHREDVLRCVKKYARRAGLPEKASTHTLRHSFASHLLAGGADLESIRIMLGHTNLSTTQIYIHTDISHIKQTHLICHPRR